MSTERESKLQQLKDLIADLFGGKGEENQVEATKLLPPDPYAPDPNFNPYTGWKGNGAVRRNRKGETVADQRIADGIDFDVHDI